MIRSSRIGWAPVVQVALGLLLWCTHALAEGPPTQPWLRPETRMHMAPIFGISADARRQLLLTVSYDKTARLWSLADGRLIRVLRPPIGSDFEGGLYTGALSPNGQIAAVGGQTGFAWDGSYSVYLFDTNSGKLVRRLAGLPNRIDSLAFSPDGALLAVGLGQPGVGAVHVWHTGDWSDAWSDTAYGGDVYGLAFSKLNDLVASSDDGYLRSYDARGKLRRPKEKAPSGSLPRGVAISPDGERVAIGYEDSKRTDVVTLRDLRLLFNPDATGVNDSLWHVAWSVDGGTLFAAYYATNAQGRRIIRAWANGGRGAFRDLPVANNTILGLMPLSGKDVAFASFEPTWGVLRDTGSVDLLHATATADYRDSRAAFRVSEDGKQVGFCFEQFGQRPATFALSDRRGTRATVRAWERRR
jgi:WD domain, G-beta repeat